jgi:hypothetical protein
MALTVPVIDLRLSAPSKGSLAFYGGLGTMAALEVIEWPVAVLLAAGHAISTNTSNPELREAVEGAEEAS